MAGEGDDPSNFGSWWKIPIWADQLNVHGSQTSSLTTYSAYQLEEPSANTTTKEPYIPENTSAADSTEQV